MEDSIWDKENNCPNNPWVGELGRAVEDQDGLDFENLEDVQVEWGQEVCTEGISAEQMRKKNHVSTGTVREAELMRFFREPQQKGTK